MGKKLGIRKRKHLEIDELIKWLKRKFGGFKDFRASNTSIELVDALLSGFAMFSLKDKSLLFFDNMRTEREENLKKVYKIGKAPSDSRMRELLDKVNPSWFTHVFKELVAELRRAGIWRSYEYYRGHLICSIDGVHHYSSEKISCDKCLEFNKANGVKEYRHYMLSGAIVHPEKREVMPVIHEPIVKQDGKEKNDCERNAGKRLLPRLRQQFPKEKLVVVEDALGSNGPHIEAIKREGFSYVLGIKEDGNEYLFKLMDRMEAAEQIHRHKEVEGELIHCYRYANDLPLNGSHRHIRVNFLEYWEEDTKTGKQQHFSWITDFRLTKKNVYRIMRIGRSRWKIENETFNTLKNQGYNFEHNYGHGEENLCTVLALLMMLAFWVDQIQQGWNELFKAAWRKMQTKVGLWERVRGKFNEVAVESMQMIYLLIIGKIKVKFVYEAIG